MKLSQKDKSLLLFIAAVLVVLWAIFSFFTSIFFAATFGSSDIKKLEIKASSKWLNASRELKSSDLKNRIILLDFWSYSCVSCIQAIPEIAELEQKFGSKITVIGVHSGKFENEKDPAAIRKAISKYNIEHLVVNDSDLKIWNNFEIKALPSFVLINPRGRVFKTYEGKSSLSQVESGISKLISKYKFQLNRDPMPLLSREFSDIGNVLSFPSKLEYAAKFSYKSRNLPAIFIANSGKNNIVASSISGEIILKIGAGQKGFEDGDFDSALFNNPKGLIYNSGKLYVADFGNNALREIDFEKGKVTTLIGSGVRGDFIDKDLKSVEAKNVNLSAPYDIEFFTKNGQKNIAIANSGTHQILAYNLKDKTVSVIAGNGSKGSKDGKYPENSLAQPSDMSVFGKKIYFVDAASSSLRVVEDSGEVKTLIGGNLEKAGHVNGNKESALMQHPSGILVDDLGVYISDSFNHVIRKYNFSSKKLSDFTGSKNRENLINSFDEPEGIVAVLNKFYVADSNNNRIVVIDRETLKASLLDVMPPLKLQKEGFLQYLPNLQESEDYIVKADSEISLKIDLKKGWKINNSGPSFINLLELTKSGREANLISNFDWQEVGDKKITLPKLLKEKSYVIQGSIYYCEDKKNALCYIKSYQQNIIAQPDAKNKELIIKLAY
jgi:thiol-disulfide isomerase/thioredoxin